MEMIHTFAFGRHDWHACALKLEQKMDYLRAPFLVDPSYMVHYGGTYYKINPTLTLTL